MTIKFHYIHRKLCKVWQIYVKKIEEKNITTIMVGKTVTYNHKIIDETNFDIGIVGETEIVIKNILDTGIENKENLLKIKGIIKNMIKL